MGICRILCSRGIEDGRGKCLNHRLEFVLDMFENVLKEKYNGEDIRDTQVKLGVAVAGLISSNDRILMCHAPVGTGKTFGALVPGIYDTLNYKSRLIYSTSSLNLQAQLKNEELHFLKERQDIKSFIVAKGITNYLCIDKIDHASLEGFIKNDLLSFSMKSSEGDRVDFEETFYPLPDDYWAMVRLDRLKDCLYCGRKTVCPTAKHRSKFNDPSINVVVTNHNQLVQSVLNIQEGRPPILDLNMKNGLIIIDEAHDFEDAVLTQLAERIVLKDLTALIRKMGEERRRVAMRFISIIYEYIKSLKRKMDSTKGRHMMSPECIQAISQIRDVLNKEITEKAAKRLDYQEFSRDERENESDKVAELLGKILDESNYSCWLTFENEMAEITIVGRKFRANTKSIIVELYRNNRLVFMSGTLAVDNSFDNIYYTWNGKIKHCTQELILPTIFNYKKQAIFYVPENLPEPVPSISKHFRDYTSVLTSEIIELIKITGGRTLILCTSYKQMYLISELIKPVLDAMGINLLKQKDKSVELLSKDFKRDETSVLIGTGSFFAGLSVPGKSLISVILCKLPFVAGEDPFMELLGQDLSMSEKMEYLYVPRMMIKLLQATGRLIRTKDDFGCFTILDPRLFTAREQYGDKILNELDAIGFPLTRDREEIRKFIDYNMREPINVQYPAYDRERLVIPDSLLKDDNARYFKEETKEDNSLDDFINTITSAQRTYYEMVRKRVGMTTVIPTSLKTPYDLFDSLVKLSYNRGLEINVTEDFPFLTDKQKESCIKRFEMVHKNIPIKRQGTRWSREQVESHFKELKIKRHTKYKEWDK